MYCKAYTNLQYCAVKVFKDKSVKWLKQISFYWKGWKNAECNSRAAIAYIIPRAVYQNTQTPGGNLRFVLSRHEFHHRLLFILVGVSSFSVLKYNDTTPSYSRQRFKIGGPIFYVYNLEPKFFLYYVWTYKTYGIIYLLLYSCMV